MHLTAIHEGDAGNVLQRVTALRGAAESLGVAFTAIDSLTYDYSSVRPLAAGDVLYNVGRGSARLETLLLGPQVTTLYVCHPLFVADRHDSTIFTAVHDRAGLRGPRTIHHLPQSREMLRRYVEALDGLPVVLKAVGGTLGVGTIICESWRSLFSTVDAIQATGQRYIMRQFIDAPEICRVTVLGGRVVAANRKFVARDDFRTSVAERGVEPMQCSAETEDLALQAAALIGVEFGGADIAITADGRAYLLEFNFPCDFITSEVGCGVQISRMIVEHLLKKCHAATR